MESVHECLSGSEEGEDGLKSRRKEGGGREEGCGEDGTEEKKKKRESTVKSDFGYYLRLDSNAINPRLHHLPSSSPSPSSKPPIPLLPGIPT